MFRGLILLAGSLLVGGCAALAPMAPAAGSLLTGPPAPELHEQTSVNLAQDNFLVVRTNVYGQSKGFSLLGFITIVPANLTTAINRMYASAQISLYRPQTVANSIVERSSSYWILFGIPKAEVHADIVEFRPAVTTNQPVKPFAANPNPPGGNRDGPRVESPAWLTAPDHHCQF
jgi:hypothetical protein